MESEIDTEAAVWRIPGSKTKNGQPHNQPLSRQALAILETVRPLSSGNPDDLVFPAQSGLSRRSGMLGINTFTSMNRKLGIDCTGHGYRSSFRVWASEQTQSTWAAMELSLGHGVGSNVEQAYNRSRCWKNGRRSCSRGPTTLTSRRARHNTVHPCGIADSKLTRCECALHVPRLPKVP